MPGRTDASLQAEGRRRFLFLQGPLSPLYRRIGERLRAAGHTVHRINFCPGDWLHWCGPGTMSYRGRPAHWRSYVARFLDDNAVTDLIVHGDRRFYHREAADEAERRGIRVIATELGYLRPGWMTIELGGFSTLSRFPAEPDAIRQIAARAGDLDLSPRYPASFVLEAWQDVSYHLTNVLFRIAYPHYRRHTPLHPLVDYACWVGRLAGAGARRRRAEAIEARVISASEPFFVVPLQIEGDYQLIAHSPFSGMAEALDRIVVSFARNAPPEARLVVKAHPLDNGYYRWDRKVPAIAADHGVGDRVILLDGGNLVRLVKTAAGLVTVNSTAGLDALQLGCPVKTLVPALFDIAGMTHQGELDGFWRAPTAPDPDMVGAFRRAVALTLQVRGSIHNRDGLDVAVDGMVRRILEDSLNQPDGAVEPPPRRARAQALGVPL